MNKEFKGKLKKPKYKIGDIIVYEVNESSSMKKVVQSRIIESDALWESVDKYDCFTWSYHTEETRKEGGDTVYEENIIFKLK